jgi:outer membrane protein OmpA-like peptidoglycan-associated protein
MMKKLLLVSMIAALTAGCAADGSMTRSEKGAIIGGVAGAVLGKITGDKDDDRAVIGGLLGAAVGAGIGAYMDKQEAELRQSLEGTGVEVSRQGEQIVLSMPDNITFDTGRYDVKPASYSVLNNLATTLVKYNSTRINIAGHTDSVGSHQSNLRLSQQRAYSVRNYMIDRGVEAHRMSAAGYGETRPVADNATAEGRARNRRVEITLQAVQQ